MPLLAPATTWAGHIVSFFRGDLLQSKNNKKITLRFVRLYDFYYALMFTLQTLKGIIFSFQIILEVACCKTHKKF